MEEAWMTSVADNGDTTAPASMTEKEPGVESEPSFSVVIYQGHQGSTVSCITLQVMLRVLQLI